MIPLVINAGSPVDLTGYVVDRDFNPVTFPASNYRCDVRRRRGDADALISFVTGAADGSIVVETGMLDGAVRTYFHFRASEALTSQLKGRDGEYVADIIRTDGDKHWQVPLNVRVLTDISSR